MYLLYLQIYHQFDTKRHQYYISDQNIYTLQNHFQILDKKRIVPNKFSNEFTNSWWYKPAVLQPAVLQFGPMENDEDQLYVYVHFETKTSCWMA